MENTKNNNFYKSLKTILFNIIFSYLLIELICFIFIKTNKIPAKLPTFKVQKSELPPVADINAIWGVWHQPKTKTRMIIGDCINVNYEINSYGARDIERVKKSTSNRTIVLGDSFMEGMGVEVTERISNVLEKKTGKEMLNFACSGNFAPTQYYLVYDSLASKFSHDEVLVGILPDNDFNDDDYEIGKKVWYYNLRYKPYWVGKYPNYELKYMQKSVNDSNFTPEKIIAEQNTTKNNVNQILKAYTCWYNIYVYYQLKKIGAELSRSNNYSGFYDYTSAQLENLMYSLEKLKSKMGERKLKVVLIPRTYDFVRYKSEGKKATTKLGNELQGFCQTKNIELIDMLPAFYQEHPTDFMNFYITCDGHWNNLGHNYAADILYKKCYTNVLKIK